MSMICWVLGLSPAQIGALRASPSLVSDLAHVSEDSRFDEMTKQMSPERKQAFEMATKELRAQVTDAQTRLRGIGPFEKALSLEKSWHMLHYLFTGHTDAFDAPGDMLLTGEGLGEDVGYGPARIHDEIKTLEFSRFLATLDLAQLQARVNFQEMTRLRVYAMPMGRGSDAEYENELRAEVAQYFPLLRDYVGEMAAKKYGLLMWVS